MSSVGAIGSSPARASVAAPAPQPANLDADLSKYQGQLADWTYCASGKTPEGKIRIQQISKHISTIKTQMRKADEARAAAKAPAAIVAHGVAPARGNTTTLGNQIDVWA